MLLIVKISSNILDKLFGIKLIEQARSVWQLNRLSVLTIEQARRVWQLNRFRVLTIEQINISDYWTDFAFWLLNSLTFEQTPTLEIPCLQEIRCLWMTEPVLLWVCSRILLCMSVTRANVFSTTWYTFQLIDHESCETILAISSYSTVWLLA